jgi:hypothetical protein
MFTVEATVGIVTSGKSGSNSRRVSRGSELRVVVVPVAVTIAVEQQWLQWQQRQRLRW